MNQVVWNVFCKSPQWIALECRSLCYEVWAVGIRLGIAAG